MSLLKIWCPIVLHLFLRFMVNIIPSTDQNLLHKVFSANTTLHCIFVMFQSLNKTLLWTPKLCLLVCNLFLSDNRHPNEQFACNMNVRLIYLHFHFFFNKKGIIVAEYSYSISLNTYYLWNCQFCILSRVTCYC